MGSWSIPNRPTAWDYCPHQSLPYVFIYRHFSSLRYLMEIILYLFFSFLIFFSSASSCQNSLTFLFLVRYGSILWSFVSCVCVFLLWIASSGRHLLRRHPLVYIDCCKLNSCPFLAARSSLPPSTRPSVRPSVGPSFGRWFSKRRFALLFDDDVVVVVVVTVEKKKKKI